MNNKLLGTLAAAAVANLLTQGALAADAKAPKKDAAKPAAAGKCVHNCNGYAMCKGNGNASCKGQNSCANTGLVPKECSSQTSEEACRKVLDKKKEVMCTWYKD